MKNKFIRDLSGKALFILGLLLIGISIFNLFEDPITSQYYKLKRNFSNQNSIPTLIIPQNTLDDDPVLVETPGIIKTEIEPDIEFTPLINFEEPENEGFLPLNVEVTDKTDATPEPTKEYDVVPLRISIPSINLKADIINAQSKEIIQGEKTYQQWLAPNEYAIGWHYDSAFLGVPGNTVLNGHHNIYGKVFEDLDKLISGDQIFISGNDMFEYEYIVSNSMILPERDVSFEKRLENARWILPSEDERITLITCWPYFSNTHRLIIVARPGGSKPLPIDKEQN